MGTRQKWLLLYGFLVCVLLIWLIGICTTGLVSAVKALYLLTALLVLVCSLSIAFSKRISGRSLVSSILILAVIPLLIAINRYGVTLGAQQLPIYFGLLAIAALTGALITYGIQSFSRQGRPRRAIALVIANVLLILILPFWYDEPIHRNSIIELNDTPDNIFPSPSSETIWTVDGGEVQKRSSSTNKIDYYDIPPSCALFPIRGWNSEAERLCIALSCEDDELLYVEVGSEVSFKKLNIDIGLLPRYGTNIVSPAGMYLFLTTDRVFDLEATEFLNLPQDIVDTSWVFINWGSKSVAYLSEENELYHVIHEIDYATFSHKAYELKNAGGSVLFSNSDWTIVERADDEYHWIVYEHGSEEPFKIQLPIQLRPNVGSRALVYGDRLFYQGARLNFMQYDLLSRNASLVSLPLQFVLDFEISQSSGMLHWWGRTLLRGNKNSYEIYKLEL